MKKITFYDTETTGLPNWKIPSDDESQPHLVQLTAIQCDAEKEEIIQRIDLIIQPDGWEIPQEVVDIHGITTKKAEAVGVSEILAIKMLTELCTGSVRVAHNKTFDQRIIRIGLKRYLGHYFIDQDLLEEWARKDNHECTMQMSKPIMKMLPKNRFGFKNPKLSEAYEYFTGNKLENAHSSIADTEACMKIYFKMKNLEKENDQD